MTEEVKEKPIDSEQAFDMLPYVAAIYDKVDFDTYRKDLAKKKINKDDYLWAAIDGAKYILRNSGKVKNEFFHIVSIAQKKTPNEVKKQPFFKTIVTIKTIFSDPELVAFFKQAIE
ncbi:hypothetical protein ACM26V_00455 [Salipaludibacillus sp. HK11]|uniref:hypothetical protein n=1 Tax=Salipaludibacillus sp. HK11 TaxID=3394320 RepID=UPI0039FBE565